MPSKFSHYPQKVRTDLLKNAYIILCNAHDASSSFIDIFEKTRKARKARGTSTDEEQDLLRAMLIFASSGLDAMIKQITRDTLRKVIQIDKGSQAMFKTHIERRLKNRINLTLVFFLRFYQILTLVEYYSRI